MYRGKNIYGRGRGRGRGGNYQNQQQGQGQGQGPGRGGGRGRDGNHSGFTDQQQRTTRRERPWSSTPPLPTVPLQRARSILDNLEIQAPRISEQPASPAESVENRIVPPDRGGTLAIQSILGSLLCTFLRDLVLWLLYYALMRISSM